MTVRRSVLAVGAVILLVGVIGLFVPVSVSDGSSESVGCGTAVAADLSHARSANNKSVANIPVLNQIVPRTDYVSQCESSLSSRRAWTIPVTIIGALAVVGALFVRGRAGSGAAGG